MNRGYLGPAASLAAFGPLLKLRTENLNATTVALFLDAIHEVYSSLDYLNSIHSDMDRLRLYTNHPAYAFAIGSEQYAKWKIAA